MTALANWLKFTRLDTNTVYVTGTEPEIIMAQIDRVNDQPEKIHIEIDILSALGTAIINATRGPGLNLDIIPLLGEYSMDGGATIDLRFVLVSAQRSLDPNRPILTIDQSDMSILYAVTGTDRVTYVGQDANGNRLITPQQILNGAAGSIPRPPGHIGQNPTWPTVKGLYQTVPRGNALVALTPAIDPLLNSLPLSLDINAATIADSTKSAATRLAGSYNPGDVSVPAGSRAHMQPHTGDRHGTGAKVIAIGHVGATSACTFDGDGTGPWNEDTTVRFTGAGLALDQLFGEMYSQTSMQGGSSSHGFAPGTKVTCMVCINRPFSGLSTRWDDNLLVVGTTSGVYYHVVGSGFFVPMSPGFSVTALAYQPGPNLLIAGTGAGAFSAAASAPAPGGTLPWFRVGGMKFPCADLWADSTSNVLVRVGGNTQWQGASVDGIYKYPGTTSAGATQGYADWDRLVHSSAIITAGGNAGDVYYVDGNQPGTVYHMKPSSTTKPEAIKFGINSIVGIDTVLNDKVPGSHPPQPDQYAYLRLDRDGGIASVQLGKGTQTDADKDNSLVDADGKPVTVNKIVQCGVTIKNEYISAFAVTDAGLFRTSSPGGNHWRAVNAASGLGDFNMIMVACGTPQTVLGQDVCRIYASTGDAVLVSCDGGDSWRNVLADNLDSGAAWYARARAWSGGAWPDNTVGALGSVAGSPGSPGSPGSQQSNSGAIVGGTTPAVPDGGRVIGPPGPNAVGALPAGWTRERRLDEQKQFTFRLVNRNSQSPQGGMQWDELSYLQAGENVGVITASEQIELVEWRWLSAAAIPRFQIPLSGSFTTASAAARDLAPNDRVTWKYNPAGWTSVFAVNMPVYVVSQSIVIANGLARTKTVVSNSTESSNLNAQALAASQADRLTKKLRFG